jgi:glycosidase
MTRILFILISFIAGQHLFAQTGSVNFQPSSWWIGMQNPRVMILVTGKEIGLATPHLASKEVSIANKITCDNNNYTLLELEISPNTKPGILKIDFTNNKGIKIASGNFLLSHKPARKPGLLNSSDVIYQLFPDRFNNGNPANDNPQNYLERSDKLNPSGIHGGDFAGIIQLIDYLKTLNISAIELTSILDNNQFINSYEHSGITNFYAPDARLGSIKELTNLIAQLHEKDIKTILTMPLNSIGKNHPMAKIPVFKEWLLPDMYVYGEQQLSPLHYNPYASQEDIQRIRSIWPELDIIPLNTNHPILIRYLTQCCIWWLLSTNADAIKIDQSYTLSRDMLNELHTAILQELPNTKIIIDIPSSTSSVNAHFQKQLNDSTQTTLTTDYSTQKVLAGCFSDIQDPNTGLMQLYEQLANDFVYNNPQQNIVFIDNYRLTRAYNNADKDIKSFLMMCTFLFANRGIPQIYYGTEFLSEGDITKSKGNVRKDFQVSIAKDTLALATGMGMNPDQFTAYKTLSKLIAWRRSSNVAQKGQTTQYLPMDGLYVLFREYENESIMIIVNNNAELKKRIDPTKYASKLSMYQSAHDVINNQTYLPLDNIIVAPKTVMILSLIP